MERLDKLLASQGMLSRREVRELITAGRVTVEGGVEKRPERKVSGQETIAVDGLPVTVQKTLTLMLHKPRGYVSAARDARDKTVLELVPPQYRRKGLFPAGRLDKDTTGLMILTDDGALGHGGSSADRRNGDPLCRGHRAEGRDVPAGPARDPFGAHRHRHAAGGPVPPDQADVWLLRRGGHGAAPPFHGGAGAG